MRGRDIKKMRELSETNIYQEILNIIITAGSSAIANNTNSPHIQHDIIIVMPFVSPASSRFRAVNFVDAATGDFTEH